MRQSGQSGSRNSLERGILLPSNVTMSRGRPSNLPVTPLQSATATSSNVPSLEDALISELKSPQGAKQGSPSFLGSQHKLQSDFRQQFVQPDANDDVRNGHIDLGQHQELRQLNQQQQQHYNAHLEATAPQLPTGSQYAWTQFLPKFQSYVLHGGTKGVADLMTPAAASYYNDVLDSGIMFSTNAELINLINDIHHGVKTRDSTSLLSSITQKPCSTFSRQSLEEYQTQFSEFIHNSAKFDSTSVSDRALAQALLSGISYLPLKKRCEKAKPADYKTAVQLIRKNILDFEIAHEIFAYIKACNTMAKPASSSSSAPKHDRAAQRQPSKVNTEGTYAAAVTPPASKVSHISPVAPLPRPFTGTCVNCLNPHHGRECQDRCKFCSNYVSPHSFKDCPCMKTHIDSEITRRKAVPKANVATGPPPYMADPDYGVEFLEAVEQVQSHDILYDSGANGIYIHDSAYFDGSLSPLSQPLRVCTATGASEDLLNSGIFTDIPAYHTPSFAHTLVGIHDLCAHNHICIFTKDYMYGISDTNAIASDVQSLISKANELHLIKHLGFQRNGLYSTSFQNIKDLQQSCTPMQNLIFQANASYYQTVHTTSLSELVKFWHESLGHPSMDTMIDIFSSQAYVNLPLELSPSVIRKYFPTCAECSIGNMSRKPLPSYATARDILPGEEFQLDLEGPWVKADSDEPQDTFSGCRYTMTAIDMKTGMPFGWLLKSRKKLVQYLDDLLLEVRMLDRTLKVLRTDDEFVTAEITLWCKTNKITILPCIPYEHGQIGKVERIHRTLRDATVKCMSNKPHLDPRLWGMCWLDCLFKFSSLPHRISHCSPYFLWFGKPVDVQNIPIIPFGSIVMAHIPLELQTKNGPRSTTTYCVGSARVYKGGLLLFNPETKRTIVRRTFKVMGPQLPSLPSTIAPTTLVLEPEILDAPTQLLTSCNSVPTYVETNIDDVFEIVHHRTEDHILADNILSHDSRSLPPLPDIATLHVPKPSLKSHKQRAKSLKQMNIHIRNEEWFKSNPVNTPQPAYAREYATGADSRGARLRNRNMIGALTAGLALFANVASHISYVDTSVPKSFSAALLSTEATSWRAALSSELQSLVSMGVYNPNEYIDPKSVDPKLIIPSKLVLAKVFEPNGQFKKYKIRIVGRGDRYDIDLDVPTYAGTVSSESLRLLIALSAEHDLEMESIDVKTAFLYPLLDESEVIYMRRPKGLTDADMPPVIRLRKCIYGLPQAAEKFRTHSDVTIRAMGFKPLISDACVYVKSSGVNFAYIAAHVDDFAIASNNQSFLNQIKAQLAETYEISVISDMHSYCGLHLVRDRANRTIDLLQTAYAQSTCVKFGIDIPLDQCPLTPMVTAETYYSSKDVKLDIFLNDKDITIYRSMVGCLLYLAKQTRADILFAVCYHARFSRTPTRRHNNGVIRILQYILGTIHLGLRFKSVNGITLMATVDASYASHSDLKSHTGCTLHIGENSGSFLSVTEKQSITADSSTVAEFIAGHTVAKKIMWARNFLSELGPLFAQSLPSVVYEDNQSTIHLFHKQSNAHKTKHIALRYNFIREQIQQGHIIIKYLSTEHMTSDILTKALGPTSFLHLRSKLLGM